MDKEELKQKIDLYNIQEREFDNYAQIVKYDYIIDDRGNAIFKVHPLQYVMIAKILELEEKVLELEKLLNEKG